MTLHLLLNPAFKQWDIYLIRHKSKATEILHDSETTFTQGVFVLYKATFLFTNQKQDTG